MHPLITALHSTDEAVRLYAVQDIAELADLQPALRLTEHLPSESSRAVRDAIVFQLKRTDCIRAYPLLFELFTSSDAYLRNAAVDIFGAGGDEALGFLTANLDHANREVRKLILDALFVIGSPAAILAIRAGLHDPSMNVRITAVEYLGRLEDHQSAPEMIGLLNHKTEPMLATAVLESLPYIANEAEIAEALDHLMPDGQMRGTNPLFITEILRLAARAADQETLCRVFEKITDLIIYADDFLRAVSEAQTRYPNIICQDQIQAKLIQILENTNCSENVRHTAGELLLAGSDVTDTELERLGIQLTQESNMCYIAARLLLAAGSDNGLDNLRQVVATVRDDDLRNLCTELLES